MYGFLEATWPLAGLQWKNVKNGFEHNFYYVNLTCWWNNQIGIFLEIAKSIGRRRCARVYWIQSYYVKTSTLNCGQNTNNPGTKRLQTVVIGKQLFCQMLTMSNIKEA